MAQGTVVVFDEAKENIVNLAIGSAFKIMLITTLPTEGQTTPDSSDFTEVSAGGGYTAGGEAVTVTVSEAAGTVTLACTTASWTSNGSGDPTNIVAALLYTTDAVSADAMAYIDMTVDAGTTPVSLLAGDVSLAFPSHVFTLA